MIVFVLGTLAILAFLTAASVQTARLLDRIPIDANLLLLPAENVLRMFLILATLGLGFVSGLPFQVLGWQAPFFLDEVLLGAILGLIVALAMPGLTLLAVRAFGPKIYNPRLVMGIIPRSPRQWVLVPLLLAPAVFLEEVLFRSYLIGGFSAFAPTVLLAVTGSIVFGLSHSAQGSLGIVAATGLGLFLAVLFIVTTSLAAPLVAHYVINVSELVWAARDKSFWDTLRRLSSQNADSRSDL